MLLREGALHIINDNSLDKIPDILREIMIKRGLREEEFKEFLSLSPQLAYDPFLLTDMREAVDLITKTIDEGGKIVIYGDYDVDGVTSVALMVRALRTLDANVDYYIPSRISEGYGLNKEAIKNLKDEGYALLVSVDCGVVSLEETKYAHSIGLNTIITDHHNPGDEIAEGIIINPKLIGDEYPFKGLAGVGVAYKFICALKTVKTIPRKTIVDLLELVALGTIADLMPLIDENRTIVKYGLNLMRKSSNLGISKLIEVSGVKKDKLNAMDISFKIAPRINAAGRINDASIGVKLLLTEDEDIALKLANRLNEINNERREFQDFAHNQCMEKAKYEIKNGDFLFIEAENCHEGILGIVAGHIKDKLKRPAVIVQKIDEENEGKKIYKGTGRSTGNVNLYEMLNENSDLLLKFGGHSMACGFTIEEENIKELKNRLNMDLKAMLEKDETLLSNKIPVDLDIDSKDVSLELAHDLKYLEPCGKGNSEPIFRLKSAELKSFRTVGNSGEHAIFDADNIRCVYFNFDRDIYENLLSKNAKSAYDIIGHIDINEWNDSENVQMRVLKIIKS